MTHPCVVIESDCVSLYFHWQMAVDQAQMQNFSSMFLPAVESVNPCLILIVRRENIVGDTMEVLRKSKNVDYKKPLKVQAAKMCNQRWIKGHEMLLNEIETLETLLATTHFAAGDFRGGRGSGCWRREKGVLPPDHEGAARSQIRNVSLLWGVQAHLVFQQGELFTLCFIALP